MEDCNPRARFGNWDCLEVKQTSRFADDLTTLSFSIFESNAIDGKIPVYFSWEYGCRGMDWFGCLDCDRMDNQDKDHIARLTIDRCTRESPYGTFYTPYVSYHYIYNNGVWLSKDMPIEWSAGTNNNVGDPTEHVWFLAGCRDA